MCALGVQLNLSKLPGVEDCEVSYQHGKATLVYADGFEPDIDQLKSAVTNLGYTPGDAVITDFE